MGRLRARLAGNEIDRELHGHLADAVRHLERAMEVCRRIPKGDRMSSRRSDNVLMTLDAAIGNIRRIGSVVPAIDVEDPDFMPEDERTRLARERRDALKKGRAERHRGTLPVRRGSEA